MGIWKIENITMENKKIGKVNNRELDTRESGQTGKLWGMGQLLMGLDISLTLMMARNCSNCQILALGNPHTR